MTLVAGTKLGTYEVLSPIGAGGMGEVYRARDTKLNRDVALKVLPEGFAKDAERMARFQREAQVLASLNHPNYRGDLRAGRIRRRARAGDGAGRGPDAGEADRRRRGGSLRLDHPRQLAVMHSLVRLAHIAAGGTSTMGDLYGPALDALGRGETQYSLTSLRYDLSKLRAKRLVEKIPHSRRYRLVGKGYSICLVFLKLFERIYAPLAAGILKPFHADRAVAEEQRCELDCLYQRISDDLDALLGAVGIKTAA